jgi:hypothetical protein
LPVEGIQPDHCRLNRFGGNFAFPLTAAESRDALHSRRPPGDNSACLFELGLARIGIPFANQRRHDRRGVPEIHQPPYLSSPTAAARLGEPFRAARIGRARMFAGFHFFTAGIMCGLSAISRIRCTRATGVFLSTMINVSPDCTRTNNSLKRFFVLEMVEVIKWLTWPDWSSASKFLLTIYRETPPMRDQSRDRNFRKRASCFSTPSPHFRTCSTGWLISSPVEVRPRGKNGVKKWGLARMAF